ESMIRMLAESEPEAPTPVTEEGVESMIRMLAESEPEAPTPVTEEGVEGYGHIAKLFAKVEFTGWLR
ncbi:MAG: hypothetical protein KKA60_06305, partial [Proteobacteria bacterium]|nr:hypothetical protein [Pseudomonadota bacterium]